MAWIESHQTVWGHAKTRKAARRLGVPIVQLVGHLQSLWHWALDHAEDGNVSKYDADDLAIAARWDGDPQQFVDALEACGPGGTAGFLERGGIYGAPGEELVGDLVIHDWWDYAGKLVARRRADRERKAAARSAGGPTDVPRNLPESPGRPEDVQRMSSGRASDGPADSRYAGTEPNQPTEPDHPPSSPDGDREQAETGADDAAHDDAPDDADEQFQQHFWPAYPAMPNGRKPEKGKALQQWRKLTLEQRRRAVRGARNIAQADTIPKHAHRFLRRDTAGEFPFDDWQEPPDDTTHLPPAERPCPECGEVLGWNGHPQCNVRVVNS